MGSNENPAPHHETPTFGNPDLPQEGMVNTAGNPAGSDHYEEVSLANWLAHLPPKLVSAHLNIPGETLAKFPRGAQGIVPLP
jgi:hypothetical protein